MDGVYCLWHDLKLTPSHKITRTPTDPQVYPHIFMCTQCVCFFQTSLPPLLQTDDTGVSGRAVKPWCVCQLSSLYVLWPVGFVFVMWQDSDTCCVYICLCVCIQLGDTAAFITKNNVFPPARPSSPQSLSSFFPSLPLNQDLCSSPCCFLLHFCIMFVFMSVPRRLFLLWWFVEYTQIALTHLTEMMFDRETLIPCNLFNQMKCEKLCVHCSCKNRK